MPTVNVPQANPNDELTDDLINMGPNAIAEVVNGQLDDANIAGLSGGKIADGTLPASAASEDSNVETRFKEAFANYTASGLVWSALTGLNGAMTAGVAYVDGKRLKPGAVASKAFTASRDTYIYISNTGSVQYVEVANGAAIPATPANTARKAKVVTSATAITLVVNYPDRGVLSLPAEVDANGWTARNYGSFTRYKKRFTGAGVAVGANASVVLFTDSPLPVGVDNLTQAHVLLSASFQYTYAFSVLREALNANTPRESTRLRVSCWNGGSISANTGNWEVDIEIEI